jgi:phosphatidylinositol alpha 1,6-mannosyltransferase
VFEDLEAAAGMKTTSAPLRVALFTGNYNYIKDGVALTLNRLVGDLQRRGVPVLVFAPTGPKPAFPSVGEVVPVPSFPIPTRPEYRIALGLPQSARARLEAFRPTLFHIAVPDLLGYRALRLAQDWAMPVVASYHTRYDTYLKFYGLGPLEHYGKKYLRYFYSKCIQTCPPSESMAAALRADGIAQNLRIWSRGVDNELFNPAKRSLDWRREVGIADDDVVITFTGRLVKEKNTDLLTRLFNNLGQGGKRIRTMIVGDGPEGPRMRKLLPKTVFTGFIHGDELARAYASSDVFFFPSESESFGNVTLEAMASGLPAVCANACGSNSLVSEGKTGFLASARDEEALLERLGRLTDDAELRRAMSLAARQRALDFTWSQVLAEMHSVYCDVTVAWEKQRSESLAGGAASVDYRHARPSVAAARSW